MKAILLGLAAAVILTTPRLGLPYPISLNVVDTAVINFELSDLSPDDYDATNVYIGFHLDPPGPLTLQWSIYSEHDGIGLIHSKLMKAAWPAEPQQILEFFHHDDIGTGAYSDGVFSFAFTVLDTSGGTLQLLSAGAELFDTLTSSSSNLRGGTLSSASQLSASVPEPGTLALLLAAVGMGAVVRRRRVG